jgi:hypothetical protein
VTRVSLFVWLLPLDLSGIGDPTSSYATVGIALRVSGGLKSHHHDKVETPSVGIFIINKNINLRSDTTAQSYIEPLFCTEGRQKL